MPEPSGPLPATPPAVAPAVPAAATAAVPPAKGRPSGRRKWLFRLAAATVVPLLLFGLLEAGLRIGGYGQTSRFFVDGSKVERPGVTIDNREFGRWVFPRGYEQTPFPVPFVLSDEKPAGTFRVFVLGESAAMGFPEPSVGFPRILEVLFQAHYPDAKVEVVNAAMVAINSHVVLPIARECADRSPDLFVVHLGNNEVVGPFGPAGVLGPFSPSRRFIKANLAVRRTRTGQLFASAVQSAKGDDAPKAWGGMTMFADSRVAADDERLRGVYDHFRDNLADICEVGRGAGTPVVVCTVPVNLRESAPFASQHRPDLSGEQTAAWDELVAEGGRLEGEGKVAAALDRYGAAEKIDDRHADLEYRLGRCYAALDRPADAQDRFGRARDLDALRFRSDSTVNRTIREAVAGRDGVILADAERSFAAASPIGLPGENLFLEHVHMNFAGNYLLARTAFEAAVPKFDGRFRVGRADPLAEKECADRLAHTHWNESKVLAQVANGLFRQPPFTEQSDRAERAARWAARLRALQSRLGPDALSDASAVYARAVADRADDWMLRMNYALLLTERGLHAEAEAEYRAVLRIHRHCFPARVKLALALLPPGPSGAGRGAGPGGARRRPRLGRGRIRAGRNPRRPRQGGRRGGDLRAAAGDRAGSGRCPPGDGGVPVPLRPPGRRGTAVEGRAGAAAGPRPGARPPRRHRRQAGAEGRGRGALRGRPAAAPRSGRNCRAYVAELKGEAPPK